jgi:hypothetical protein
MHVRKRGNKTSFSLSVVGIQVTRPIYQLDEHGVYETYYRTIRFRLSGGKVLEVYVSGVVEDYIKLRSVKRLKPVRRRKPAKTPENADNTTNDEWLTPKVYQGDSEVLPPPPTAMDIIKSGVRALRDMLLEYVGHVKRMFW